MFSTLIVLFGFLHLTSPLQKSTPLRLDDIQIEEIYVRLDLNNFKLYIYNTHFNTDPTIFFCFRERVILSAKNNKCQLGGLLNSYKCLEIQGVIHNNRTVTVSSSIFDSDYTLTSPARANISALPSSSIAVASSQVSITFTSYVSDNKIYEVYAGYQPDLRNDPFSKNAFFNTFRLATQTSSDDLLAQRHPQCFQFYYQNYTNFNIVFYGGVLRGDNHTMFFHVLSFFAFQNTSVAIGSNLNGYIGVSWSRDHGNRDMAAFITANSTLFDLFSLYYNAPYLDESIHIVGTSDILSVTDSAMYTGGADSHYFYGGFARLYDTYDSFGDQMIRKKMNNTYCIAVGFHNLNNSFPYSPLLAINTHLDHGCFTSFVVLWENICLVSFLVFGSLIMI